MKIRDIGYILVGAGVGAGSMYFLDPIAGKRRRALLSDKSKSAANQLKKEITNRGSDLMNRATGKFYQTKSRLLREAVDDEVLIDRVRSALGHAVANPKHIHVACRDGRVTLAGPVTEKEQGAVLEAVRSVNGVADITNGLTVEFAETGPQIAV